MLQQANKTTFLPETCLFPVLSGNLEDTRCERSMQFIGDHGELPNIKRLACTTELNGVCVCYGFLSDATFYACNT